MLSNNVGLFKKARESRKLSNIITAPLLVILFIFVGQIIGDLLYRFALAKLTNDNATLMSLSMASTFIFVTLLVFARVKLIEKRDISTMGFEKNNFIGKYLLGFIIGLIMFSLVVLILFVTGNLVINREITIKFLSSILIVLPGWIIQSSSEEIVTRGWLMNVIGARYNAALGIIMSSSIFGLLHLLNPNVSLVAIINIILVGIFLALYVVKTENLWGACGIHAAWNWAQGSIFGFAVSGNELNVESLMKLSLKSSNSFNGGSFGPEAGFVSTIVLICGILIVYYMINKNERRIFY